MHSDINCYDLNIIKWENKKSGTCKKIHLIISTNFFFFDTFNKN